MRFAAPRSISPSPVRRTSAERPRTTSGFGIPTHSSDEDDSDGNSEASSSSDSFCYASESEVPPPPPRPHRGTRTDAEMQHIEDAIASIRLRTRHHDVYEEWEKETRRDAFRTARRAQVETKHRRHDDADRAREEEAARLAAAHQAQAEAVAAQLAAVETQRRAEEARFVQRWRAQDTAQRARIEAVIAHEEALVRAREEAVRRVREEEARKRAEEEARKRVEEEAKRREEEARKQQEEANKREEEERRVREEREKEDKRAAEETEKRAAEEGQRAAEEQKGLGYTTAEQDWRASREMLMKLKGGPLKAVKSDPIFKPQWNALRRQFTTKMGQLTNDTATINRISEQIYGLMHPNPPLHPALYISALAALAKAILRQAETEVTAEPRSARPLAAVAVHLLAALPQLAPVLWARTCQRAGGWPIPCVIPAKDWDGTPFAADADAGPGKVTRRKAMGYRDGEANADYGKRVTGIMRVYFEVLRASADGQPLDRMWRLPRLWTWMARVLNEPRMLDAAVAPQVIFAALDVLGADVRTVWGAQWTKMLALLYEGVTLGHGAGRKPVGGESAEGRAARVRVQLEIERIMGGAMGSARA